MSSVTEDRRDLHYEAAGNPDANPSEEQSLSTGHEEFWKENYQEIRGYLRYLVTAFKHVLIGFQRIPYA